jgi:hypothetical protein
MSSDSDRSSSYDVEEVEQAPRLETVTMKRSVFAVCCAACCITARTYSAVHPRLLIRVQELFLKFRVTIFVELAWWLIIALSNAFVWESGSVGVDGWIVLVIRVLSVASADFYIPDDSFACDRWLGL